MGVNNPQSHIHSTLLKQNVTLSVIYSIKTLPIFAVGGPNTQKFVLVNIITVYDKNFAGEKFCQRLVLSIGTKISPNLILPTARALGRK